MGFPSLGQFMFFTLCMGIASALLGHTVGIYTLLGIQSNADSPKDMYGNPVYGGKPVRPNSIVEQIGQVFINPNTQWIVLGLLSAGLAAGLLGYGQNFSAMFLIPVILFLIMMNFLFFPFGDILYDSQCSLAVTVAQACPGQLVISMSDGGAINISAILLLLFNVFLVAGIVQFIRGGSL